MLHCYIMLHLSVTFCDSIYIMLYSDCLVSMGFDTDGSHLRRVLGLHYVGPGKQRNWKPRHTETRISGVLSSYLSSYLSMSLVTCRIPSY